MQIKDIYDRDYTCSKCNGTVNYGKVYDDKDNLVTKDKKPFNKQFGKASNALSAAVDKGTTKLHPCYASNVVRDFDELTGEVKPSEPIPQMQVQGMSAETEKNLKAFENEVGCAYVKLHGIAKRFAPKDALDREIHITTMGLMHDYFSFLNSQ